MDFLILSRATPGTASCMRSCYAWPFDFTSWEDNIAWYALEVQPETNFDVWVEDNWSYYVNLWMSPINPYLNLGPYINGERITKSIRAKRAYVPWADMASAQRTCSISTAINLVPPVVALAALLLLALALLILPVIAFQFIASTLLSILTYTHTR